MIQIENISKNFEHIKAVKTVSLSIQKNEIFGFIGADGAGKTTLMRMIVSLIIPDTGTITIDGANVVDDYKTIRTQIGYMPGRFSLYSDLTVEENLSFYASVFGTSIEENYYLIEDIYKQIEPFKTRRAGKLSGGMKQKLALSCALIHKPKVLVLDEPTTGVDAVSRKEFWEMLSKLKNYGITILVSTPYMDEADRCDKVALMQDGTILAIETPKGITQKFGKTIYNVRASETHRLLTILKSWKKTLSVYPFGLHTHLTVSENTSQAEILEFITMNNFQNINIEESFSSIEDVFMDLMQNHVNE